MSRMTIVGCGDVGTRVAQACLDRGDTVTAWVRSKDSVERLRSQHIPVLQVDLDELAGYRPEVQGQQLFYFAPPPGSGREDTRVRRLIAALQRNGSPSKVVYVSTTGVYGDCQGEWVDETRKPAPKADRAHRRLDAEQQWQAWRQKAQYQLVILRVAGIYGPGKLPIQRLKQRQPMVRETDAPITNHIHSLDLVEICLAAMARGKDGEIYNVSDGQPDSMTSYFNQVADFVGLPRPPLISLEQAKTQLSPGMLSYLQESRRLSNHKLLHELGIQLLYPSLQEGLPACVDSPAVSPTTEN